MKKNIVNEINDMKYLFNYNRGRIISEQEQFEYDEVDIDNTKIDDFSDEDEDLNYLKGEMDEEFDLPMMSSGTKEKERTITTPGEKTKKSPKTPYRPKPGPKPDPKAERKGDMPDWLTFDELGIDFE